MTPSAYAKTDNLLWALPFSQTEWELTPSAVQAHLQHLQQRVNHLQQQVDTLQGRVEQTSQTSSKPPSSDSPCKKPQRPRQTSRGKRGARKGHAGTGPTLLTPTEVHLIEPAPCACGHGELVSLAPYHTHQVIELPPIDLDMTHFVLHQGECAGCGSS